ncbi:MAG: hypothetical protein P8M25_15460, partial [Paracoccaceae bacterium]|nr:hypothetical protein [Paracoccaceae bacterium]
MTKATVRTKKSQGWQRSRRRENFASFVLLLPYLILMMMFAVFPVLYAFGLSFFDTIDYVFWGLTNYRAA